MNDLGWFYVVAGWAEDRNIDLGDVVDQLDKQTSYAAAREQFAQGASHRVLRQLLDAARLEMNQSK